MPEGVRRYNAGIQCDMAIGPCACGAWHSAQHAIDWFGECVRNAEKSLRRRNALLRDK